MLLVIFELIKKNYELYFFKSYMPLLVLIGYSPQPMGCENNLLYKGRLRLTEASPWLTFEHFTFLVVTFIDSLIYIGNLLLN